MQVQKIFSAAFFLLLWVFGVSASAVSAGEAERDGSLILEDSLKEQMELEEIQDSVDRLLGENRLSVSGSVDRLLQGEDPVSGTELKKNLFEQLSGVFREQRETWIQLLVLVLAAAMLSGFSALFENGQLGDIGFYMIYLLVFALMLKNFQTLSGGLRNYWKVSRNSCGPWCRPIPLPWPRLPGLPLPPCSIRSCWRASGW